MNNTRVMIISPGIKIQANENIACLLNTHRTVNRDVYTDSERCEIT